MAKPTLQEIAAMPLPASLEACRRWYDRYWALFAGEEREIVVTIDYQFTTESYRSFTVTAHSAADAEKQARDAFQNEEGRNSEILQVRLHDPHHPVDHPSFDFASVH